MLEAAPMAVDASDHISISISTEPWDQMDVDVFVCPTNSLGKMTTYPASKIRELAGREIEVLVKEHTPLAIGAAFVTPGGKMKARNIVHVPNTDKPGGKVQVEDVLRATAAVIVACRIKGFQTIAMPLMGAFESGIPGEEAARAIHSEFRSYRGDKPLRVVFMAKDADEVEVFEMAIEGTG